MDTVRVVGAVIVDEPKGLVLCAQRGRGSLEGMWEFPGGKIEPGETPRQALQREIREELHCDVTVGPRVTCTTHTYDFGTIELTTFLCALGDAQPELTEHQAVKWEDAEGIGALDWAPADRPAVTLVRQRLGER